MIKIFRENTKAFESQLYVLENRYDLNTTGLIGIEATVLEILKDIRKDGDRALRKLTKRFDNYDIYKGIKINTEDIQQAYKEIDKDILNSFKKASHRIFDFHKRQAVKSGLRKKERDDVYTGQITMPLNTVGVYVPGGKGIYPSTVLMNAIPAKVAGVKRIIMCTPAENGHINPYVIAVADLVGIDEIYKVGGAQAIAAMAYGTGMVPKVDKIVGPGSIFVAVAKRLVYGIVDIDMVAGPTEVVVVADKTAKPSYIASDLISQAEHDEMAIPVLITTSYKVAKDVILELGRQTELLPRRAIIWKAIKDNCKIFLVRSIKRAVEISNRIAPEHLSLSLKDPETAMKEVKYAGAIFLGHYSPEAVGDYIAGPNHVLPTSGAARFASPLGVYDFIRRISFIHYSKEGLKKVAFDIKNIAKIEGFTGHFESVAIRIKQGRRRR